MVEVQNHFLCTRATLTSWNLMNVAYMPNRVEAKCLGKVYSSFLAPNQQREVRKMIIPRHLEVVKTSGESY